jgi:hypothetical protein
VVTIMADCPRLRPAPLRSPGTVGWHATLVIVRPSDPAGAGVTKAVPGPKAVIAARPPSAVARARAARSQRARGVGFVRSMMASAWGDGTAWAWSVFRTGFRAQTGRPETDSPAGFQRSERRKGRRCLLSAACGKGAKGSEMLSFPDRATVTFVAAHTKSRHFEASSPTRISVDQMSSMIAKNCPHRLRA